MEPKSSDDIKSRNRKPNEFVAWVLRTVSTPTINPHEIMKEVQTLVKQAITKSDDTVNNET